LRVSSSRRDFVRPQQKKRRAPKRIAQAPATAIPAIAPLDRPEEPLELLPTGNGFVDPVGEGDADEVEIPEGRGDSGGKGSPGCSFITVSDCHLSEL
jgi:hypothetical protein